VGEMRISSLADVIIDFISREKEVSLEQIIEETKKYNGSFNENDVKEILNTLEEEGLVEINYKLTRCYVKWLGPNVVEEKKENEEEKDEGEEGAEKKDIEKKEMEKTGKEKEEVKGGKKGEKSKKEEREKKEKEKHEKVEGKTKEEEIIKQVIKEEKKEKGEKIEIEKKEKEAEKSFGNIFVILLICIVVFSSLAIYFVLQAPQETQASSLVEVKEVKEVKVPTIENESKTKKEVKNESRISEFIVHVNSYNYGFSPNKIEVESGKNVKLIIKNSGDRYTFVIKDYNVSVPVSDEAIVEFFASKKGTFHYKAEGVVYPMEGILVIN
jgi:plastocyanin